MTHTKKRGLLAALALSLCLLSATAIAAAQPDYADPTYMEVPATTDRSVTVYDELSGTQRLYTLSEGHAVTIHSLDDEWALISCEKDGEPHGGTIELRHLSAAFDPPLKGAVTAAKSARLYTAEGKPQPLRLKQASGDRLKVVGISGGYAILRAKSSSYRIRLQDITLRP